MRSLFVLTLAAIVSLASCGQSEQERMNAAMESLVAAERAFNDKAAADGISAAFMSVLADDGVLFRPGPRNGKEIYSANPNVPGLLIWSPAFAEISRAGDLGYTTGPWQFWKDSTKSGWPNYGEYMSIWRRQSNAPWQLVADFGIGHTVRELDSSLTTFLPGATSDQKELTAEDVRRLEQELLETDRAYSEMSKTKGKAEAFEQYTLEPFSFLRPGCSRLTTRDTAIVILNLLVDRLTWEPSTAVVSRSGDLGYTYGEMLHRSAFYEEDPGERFVYLHVWRKTAEGSWKVALDIAQPLPVPNEQAGE
jgi:ketosteroid isomerase-like protein